MPKKPSSSPALVKARAYCARQERAQQEVRDKLYAWGEHKTQVEAIIAQLIGEGSKPTQDDNPQRRLRSGLSAALSGRPCGS